MKTISGWVIALGVCLGVVLGGCDVKPAPIMVNWWKTLEVVAVDPGDTEELEGVTKLEKGRVMYRYRLTVLKGYYNRVGIIDKYNDTVKELKNLDTAQWFAWEGIPEVLPPEGESIDTADERLLVEYTVAARNDYKIALSDLYQFYQNKDRQLKAEVVKRTAERLDFVRMYGYLAGAEIPPGDLAPVEVIPEADAMFTKATELHFWGKLIPLLPDYRKQREALNLLTQLVRKHPKSTKIAFSAFYIGEIYKEYFNENLRAVRWYERAWTWDPTITKPARFQAAAVLDLRLNEKEKAVELYRQVIEKEQFNQSNVRFARERIQLLTQEPKPKR